MSEDKSPIQQALDLTFYAPLGLVLAVREAVPAWVEKGRQGVGQQVTVARVVGEMAARQAQRTAERAIRQSTETLAGLGIIPGPSPPSDGGPPNGRPRAPGMAKPIPATEGGDSSGKARGPVVLARRAQSPDASAVVGADTSTEATSLRSAASADAAGAVDLSGYRPEASAELAIPGYDSLSASQVVQRLAGLSPPELEAVQAYEANGRSRRTILNKITQLRSGST